jgi:5-methylcytosine-specific restriction endonuclease McrA
MKICTKCKVEKPKTEFSKHKKGVNGIRASCKECENSISRAWRIENKDLNSEIQKAWRSLNSEHLRDYKKSYHTANSAKISEKNKAWIEDNRERKYMHNRNRRSVRNSAAGMHTDNDINAIFNSQKGLCATCETELSIGEDKVFHVDHIMPLAKGGSNDKYNLQCLCPRCNMSKHAKDPIAWANENGKLL